MAQFSRRLQLPELKKPLLWHLRRLCVLLSCHSSSGLVGLGEISGSLGHKTLLYKYLLLLKVWVVNQEKTEAGSLTNNHRPLKNVSKLKCLELAFNSQVHRSHDESKAKVLHWKTSDRTNKKNTPRVVPHVIQGFVPIRIPAERWELLFPEPQRRWFHCQEAF